MLLDVKNKFGEDFMTLEERYKITSNDYMDFFVMYNGNLSILEKYQNYTQQIMNNRYAIIYVPVSEMTMSSIVSFGYAAFPSCYSLASQRSLEVSGVERLRRFTNFNLYGDGVLIGIVDTGIDYTNPIFIREDGTSKIVSIWDQTIDSEDQFPEGTFYGTEYTARQMNQALASSNPFEIVPSRDENGHGTALAGIAAGNIVPDARFSGVAPAAGLAIVKLKEAKQNLRDFFFIPDGVPCYQENDIMWGVRYLVSVARRERRPMVILIGLSSSQGAHDGMGHLGSMLSIFGDLPSITVVLAAGNEGGSRRHFFSTIDPQVGNITVELNVGDNENSFAMELWGETPNSYSVDIISPSGEFVPRIGVGLQATREISFLFEDTILYLDSKLVEIQSGQQLILFRFRNPARGTWRFQVHSLGDLTGSIHVWLPSDNFISNGTYFLHATPYTTITNPGNSIVPITITAYNPDSNVLYVNASRGYSRINTIKPELAAPGVNILSPTLDHGFQRITGTSAAAAHAAGIAAMILEWGIVRGNSPRIDAVEVKKLLIRGANRRPDLSYPNRDWGYGTIDIFSVFNILRSDFL